MSVFHDSVEWKARLCSLLENITPDEKIDYSLFQDFIQFFNSPIRTWKIPYASEVKGERVDALETTELTEQVVLEETRHYLWGNFYNRLLQLEFDKGEVFHIQHQTLNYPEFKDQELDTDEFPPHSLIYEACLHGEGKFIRIWTVSLPNLPRYTFDDGESFTQYYEYAKLHIPQLDGKVNSEEELFMVIEAERKRHNGQPYATVAGQRDKEPHSIIYFYWATHFFFSAELFLDETSSMPYLCHNPHLYPYPVQYVRAKNFRKFRYLISEP